MLLTWLYVPGDRPDRFARAVGSGADAVILDLEDAVLPGRRAYAREAVAEFLSEPPGVPAYVRVSAPAGPELEADLAALAGRPGLAGLRLPKVESAAAVAAVAARCRVELHPVVESALGLEHAYAIAAAHPAVAGISLGEADLRSDLGLVGDDGLAWPRGRIVVAARAAGLPAPVMSVYPHVSDPSGLDASTRRARRLGFVGRSAIHPRQLPVIVAAFRPAAEEVDRANALLATVAAGEEAGSGVVVLPDGRFADRAMVAAARATVDLEAYTRVRPAG